jgi:hypothetical protein
VPVERPVLSREARSLLAVAVLGLLLAVTTWWIRGADVRRVNDACDTWLEHRGSLRSLVSETEEAVERALEERARRTTPHFNDYDDVAASFESWQAAGPGVIDSLEDGDDASSLERGAVFGFTATGEGLVELRRLIEQEEPQWVASWISEIEARFQLVDDTCLSAARR